MRYILYRGKRLDNDEWIEGFLCSKNIIKHIRQCFDWRGDYVCDSVEEHKVDSKTVGQFTGLTDNNGNKIFEGDIVKYSDEEYYCPEECTEFIGEIVFEKGAFGIGCRKELPIDLDYWCDNDNFVSLWELYWNLNCAQCELPMIEVIGNVFDNNLEVEE